MRRLDLNSMDIEPKTEYGRLPFMRSARETAIRRLASVLGFLCGMEVISGKIELKMGMPVSGLIPTGIQENKKR
jgi:hypothetical protein